MGIRRQARELSMQILFAMDACERWSAEQAEFLLQHYQSASGVRKFAGLLVEGVRERLSEIDEHLTGASEHWSLSRMSRVDRALLRLAVYELLYSKDVPTSVVINEAIEIAQRFGAEDSPNFINGVLDRVARQLRRESARAVENS